MRALLAKNKADNKRFFYGVTSTLILYALDEYKNGKLPANAPVDEFFVIGVDSKYIPMADVIKKRTFLTILS